MKAPIPVERAHCQTCTAHNASPVIQQAHFSVKNGPLNQGPNGCDSIIHASY